MLLFNLAIQRELSLLPLASGPGFTYQYNSQLGIFERCDRVPPPDFWRAETVGRSREALSLSASYFSLDASIAARNGRHTSLDVDTATSLLSGAYGVTDRVDVYLAAPLVYTDAHGHIGTPTPARGQLTAFDSSEFGLGRVLLGSRWRVWEWSRSELYFNPEIFLPRPGDVELAGPKGGSFLPRAVAKVPVLDWVSLYTDVGYEIGFDSSSLNRLVWQVAAGGSFSRLGGDIGIAGSTASRSRSIGATTLGRDDLELVTGAKVPLWEAASAALLSVSFGVPVGPKNFRPNVRATLGVEVFF